MKKLIQLFTVIVFMSSVAVNATVSLEQYKDLRKDCSVTEGEGERCDWSEALQALVNNHNDVFIPAGVYEVHATVNLNKDNLTIKGAGASSLLLAKNTVAIFSAEHEGYENIYLGNSNNLNYYYQGLHIEGLAFGALASESEGGYATVGIRLRGVTDSKIVNVFQGGLDKFIDYDGLSTSIISNVSTLNIRKTNSKSKYIIYSPGAVFSNDNTLDKIVGYATCTNIYLGRALTEEPTNKDRCDDIYPGESIIAGAIQDGLTISNSYFFHSGQKNIFVQHALNTNIYGNKLFGGNTGSIYVNRGENVSVTDNVIVDDSHGTSATGIHFTHEQGWVRFGNIKIEGNIVRKSSGHGIRVGSYRGVSITGNTIVDACRGTGVFDGIHVRNSNLGIVADNLVYASVGAEDKCRQAVRLTHEGSTNFTIR